MLVLATELLYVCGDSHSAGGELPDDILWPDIHPGFYHETDARDMLRLLAWRDTRHKKLSLENPIGYPDYYELCHDYAWPNLLSKKVGYQVINDSIQGASMEWIARQTMTTIGVIKSKMPKTSITAIIQPAYWSRLQMYDPVEKLFSNFQLSDPGNMDSRIFRWFISHETDYSLVTRWIVNLSSTVAVLERFGCKVHLLDSGFLPAKEDLINCTDMHSTYKEMVGSKWVSKSMFDISKTVKLSRCPDHHYSRDVHEKVAEEMFSFIK